MPVMEIRLCEGSLRSFETIQQVSRAVFFERSRVSRCCRARFTSSLRLAVYSFLCLVLVGQVAVKAEIVDCDVVVYGATPGGFCAAIAA